MKSIKTNNLLVLRCLFFICVFCCIALTWYLSKEEDYTIFGVCLIVELMLYLGILRYQTGSFLNFATIFMCTLFVFQFGQVVILAFFSDMVAKYQMRIVLTYFNDKDCFDALIKMNMAFVAMLMGSLLSDVRIRLNSNRAIVNEIVSLDTNLQVERWAKLIIVCTFPIKFFVDALLVLKSFTQGFLNASHWLQSFPNFIRTYGNISLVGFALLIVSLRNKPKQQKIAYISIMIYLIVLMLSGWRSENVAYVVVITYLYIASRDMKIKGRNVIGLAIAFYLFLAVLYTVVAVRFSADRSLDAYFDMFSRVVLGDKNVILESLREYGNTGYTTMCVLERWLPTHDISMGKSYFFGVFAIFPNVTGVAGRLTTEAAFALDLQRSGALFSDYSNIGGSILGEFFFNFGIIGGTVFAFVIGYFIGRMSLSVSRHVRYNNVISLIYYIPIMFSVLYWIRDVFGGGVRDAVWGILFCYIFKLIAYRKRTGNNEGE